MNPKLEELRKRFLPPPRGTQPGDTIFSRDPQPSSEPVCREQPLSTDRAESAESADALVAKGSPPAESSAEQVAPNADSEIEVDEANSVDQLVQAIDKLFEPSRRCSVDLADISKASDVFLELTGSAFRAFESLKDFRDHMRKLSNSFVSMRTLQNDLGVLAESFDPVRALHREVMRLTDAVQIRLAQVAKSLEPANVLRAHVGELAQILENATELQAEFYDLAKAFGPAVDATATGVKRDPEETA